MNDLSSAVAVGAADGRGRRADGGGGEVGAHAALAPMLVVFALARRRTAPGADVGKRALDHLPGFLLGYVGARGRARAARSIRACVAGGGRAARRRPARRRRADGHGDGVHRAAPRGAAGSSRRAWRALAVGGGGRDVDGVADAHDGHARGARRDGRGRRSSAAAGLVAAAHRLPREGGATRRGPPACSSATREGADLTRRRGDARCSTASTTRAPSTTRRCGACFAQLHPVDRRADPRAREPAGPRRRVPLGDVLGGQERLGARRRVPRAGLVDADPRAPAPPPRQVDRGHHRGAALRRARRGERLRARRAPGPRARRARRDRRARDAAPRARGGRARRPSTCSCAAPSSAPPASDGARSSRPTTPRSQSAPRSWRAWRSTIVRVTAGDGAAAGRLPGLAAS